MTSFFSQRLTNYLMVIKYSLSILYFPTATKMISPQFFNVPCISPTPASPSGTGWLTLTKRSSQPQFIFLMSEIGYCGMCRYVLFMTAVQDASILMSYGRQKGCLTKGVLTQKGQGKNSVTAKTDKNILSVRYRFFAEELQKIGAKDSN